jgi:hypothetical protein
MLFQPSLCRSLLPSSSIVTFAAGSLLFAVLCQCGGNNQPAQGPESTEVKPKTSSPRKNAPGISQELGSLDPKEVDKVFARLTDKFLSCQKAAMSRIEFLAGDIKVFVRINQEGAARYAYMEDSTMGDREVERCMIQAVMSASWPKPDGGEGEARKSFSFDAGDARPPTAWSKDKLGSALDKVDGELSKCAGGTTGFRFTLYVEPNGKDGKVMSVGIASPNKDADAKADCFISALRGAKVPSPGSYAAKVSFSR